MARDQGGKAVPILRFQAKTHGIIGLAVSLEKLRRSFFDRRQFITAESPARALSEIVPKERVILVSDEPRVFKALGEKV